uniref:Uncharacterized protein n=1 Tax=Arundo donax TaxID=35708 RepID=A0A0A9G6Q6_ARUDO
MSIVLLMLAMVDQLWYGCSVYSSILTCTYLLSFFPHAKTLEVMLASLVLPFLQFLLLSTARRYLL